MWMDYMKLCYIQKKLHVKRRGKLYRMLRKQILNNNERAFIGDIRNLCKKYRIPDITLIPITVEFIAEACRDHSRRKSMMVTLSMKKIPPMLTLDKVWNVHYTFNTVEARAITAMRTGNLIYKNWCPWKMLKRHMGDLRCLVKVCQEPDTLDHVMKCQFYDSKFSEGGEGPTRDWAQYLVSLHLERMEKFSQPLICFDGWAREVQSEDEV